MKKIFACILFLLLTASSLLGQTQAQYKGVIRGVVKDTDTGGTLPGATIMVLGTDPVLGTVTDPDGKFTIKEVNVGRQSLGISFLGYEPVTLSNLLVGTGKELYLEIELRESITALTTVVVTASEDNSVALNDMAIVSARSFSVEETKRFAAGVSDPARMITAYAGVSGNGGDDENGIVIRGNSPRGLLWRLEGMEIPNPNHFATEGASSGAISLLSANTLSRSDFYTGAFPAEFGNALSGAFDIVLRNGNNEKSEKAFQASVLGLEAALEGPINVNTGDSYLVNYRYSTLSLFTKLGVKIVGEDQETAYQDGAFKVFLPSKNAGDFSFYGIGGKSTDAFKPTGGRYRESTESDMGVMGMSHLLRLNPRTNLKSGLAYSATSTRGITTDPDSNEPYDYTDKKVKTFLRASTRIRTKFNARHVLESGLTYTQLAYDFNETETSTEGGVTTTSQFFDQDGKSSMMQAYVSWRYRITDNLSLVNGAHLLYFNLNDNMTIEPRSALRWQFKENQSLSLGFGIHSRIESLEYYLANLTENGVTTNPNRDLGFTKARHFVLGYDRSLGANWNLKAETYLQKLFNVPVSRDMANPFSSLLLSDGYIETPLVNEGTGTNYGLELTLQRSFNNNFYMLFSGSVYEATYKARDGVKRNTPFNSNFGMNLLTGKEFVIGKSGENLLGLNLRATWGGNKRFIPIDLEASRQEGTEVWDQNNAYAQRHPDFFKVDFQFSYRINKPNSTHEFRLELLNLTNRRNVRESFYNDNIQNIEFDYQTRLIPGIGYRIEF